MEADHVVNKEKVFLNGHVGSFLRIRYRKEKVTTDREKEGEKELREGLNEKKEFFFRTLPE